MRSSVLFLSLSLALTGCFSTESEEPAEVTSEGVDIENNPLGALSALANMGNDLQNLQEELEAMPDVEPVHFNELIAALPEPPSGWTAQDPKGQTSNMGGMKLSNASRVYTEEDGDGRVEIEISDWAFNKAVYVPFMMRSKFSQESTEGWNKGITVGEDPGYEEYKTKSRRGERMVLYGKRYPIKINVRNQDAEAFDEWWKSIPVGDLPQAQ